MTIRKTATDIVRNAKTAKLPVAVTEILERPYSHELRRNSDGTWFARIVEFEGCMTEGDTETEALENLDRAMRGWLNAKLSMGAPIPEPKADF
jgi:predicted RNase H-like HicB family nuclease